MDSTTAAWTILDMDLTTQDHNACAPIVSRLLEGDPFNVNSAKQIASRLYLQDRAAQANVQALTQAAKPTQP